MFPQLHTYVTFRENLLSLNKLFGSFITAICYNKYVGTYKGQPNKQMKINNLIYKARQAAQKIPLQIYKKKYHKLS